MRRENISKEDAVRLVLEEGGDVPADDLVAFVQRRFGFRIETRYVPLFKASIRARDHLEQARKARGSEKLESGSSVGGAEAIQQ